MFSFITLCIFAFGSIHSNEGSSSSLHQSDACYLSGECGLHWLGCPDNERIAISSASHGFKPYSDACFREGPGVDCLSLNTTFCCSEEPDKDCVLSYREKHLQMIYEKCSGHQTCKTPPIAVTDACYSMSRSEPASFSKVNYGCVKETNIANFCHRDLVIGPSVSTVFKPNGLNMLYDKNCFCRVEAASSAVIDVQVYAYDIRFSRSTSDTCSELSITKGYETHGTVSTPTRPGEGFIHSFLPLINMTTPILTRLMLSKYALPNYIWLHFESSSGDLRVKCGRDSNNQPPSCMKDIVPTVPSVKDFTPDPVTQPKKRPVIVGVMFGCMVILFSEKTPIIGGGIAAVMAFFVSLICGFLFYRRRHLKTILSIQTPPVTHGSPKQPNQGRVSKVNSPKLGLGRGHKVKKVESNRSRKSSSSRKNSKSHEQRTRTISENLESELQQIQSGVTNDGDIIIVRRTAPSRNASVRSSCTCSSQQGPAGSSNASPPDVVLDSRAALHATCNDFGGFSANTCGHNRIYQRYMNFCRGDQCGHNNSVCIHGHNGHRCGNEVQFRPNRLNSVVSQASIGTHIYGEPLPEVPEVSEVPELPILPKPKRGKGKRKRIVLSEFIDGTRPMYIVHNTKDKEDPGSSNTNKILTWLKKCKPFSKRVFEISEGERRKSEETVKEQEEETVIANPVTTTSVLPLAAIEAPVQERPPSSASSSGSVPSIEPPKPPPRVVRPVRPPRNSIGEAIRTMNDVYVQVVTPSSRRQSVKPRVPRKRTQESSTQVYQDVPIASTSAIRTPAIIEITPEAEAELSNYANDYIVPVHTKGYPTRGTSSKEYSVKRGAPSYDEVSLSNTEELNFLHTVTLDEHSGEYEEEEEGDYEEGFIDKLKSVVWQGFMRFRKK